MKYETIHQFLEQSAHVFPHKIAVITAQKSITFHDLNALANGIAAALEKYEIIPGDRVITIIENSIEYCASYYGILKSGCVAIPLHTGLPSDTIASLLSFSCAKAIICGSQDMQTVLQATLKYNNIKILITNEIETPHIHHNYHCLSWKAIESMAHSRNQPCAIPSNSLANIIFTSGSTGVAKGVMLSHTNIITNTSSICSYLSLTSEDRQMVVLPFAYVMGQSLLNTHISVGGSLVIHNAFIYTASVLKQMAEQEVTGFSGVPSTYAHLVFKSPLAEYKNSLPKLRYCTQAGGHMTKELKLQLRNTLPTHTQIFIMYGATEASARLSYLDPHCYHSKIGSIGKAIPHVTLSIINEKGLPSNPNEIGELVARGDNIMMGYLNDPEATNAVIDASGYHTGDMGYCDDEGFFFVVGRKDSLVKVGGHRISVQEIEETIMKTELIVECVVLALPDPLKGNSLIALVVFKDLSTTSQSVLHAISTLLPKYKIPSAIYSTDALPKNLNGKIDRKQCEDLIKSLQLNNNMNKK